MFKRGMIPTAMLLGAGLWVMSPVSSAQAIKKCQDADGNWHYGTVADAGCADSIVDTLSAAGNKIGSDAPPPTEEELQRREKAAEALKLQKDYVEDQRKRDLEILRIYGSEETIISTRDRKLSSIDNNIEITRQIKEGTLKDINKLLKAKKTKKVERQLEERENAVKSYNRVIRHNLTEREKLSEKYIGVLTEFREARTRVYGE